MVSDYGSYDGEERERRQFSSFRYFGVLVTVGMVCAAGAGFVFATKVRGVTPQSMADVGMDLKAAEAAAKRDFGAVTAETIQAEATMSKYGVRLAEAVKAAPALAEASAVSYAGDNAAPLTGGWFNYPVKSFNLAGAAQMQWYTKTDEGPLDDHIKDLHGVQGIQTSDGGYVLVGKGIQSSAGSSTVFDAFAVKFSAAGVKTGFWYSGMAGSDAANAAVQLADGSILVAGWSSSSAAADAYGTRALWRLNIGPDGSLTTVWTAAFDTATSGGTGAVEMITLSGSAIYLAGLTGKADTEEMSFKSYGNCAGGKATVMKIPLTAITAAAPPTYADKAWEVVLPAYATSKSAHELADGSVAWLLWAEQKQAAIAVVNADGTLKTAVPWDYPEHYEATDMQISTVGGVEYAMLSGQGGDAPLYIGLNGHLTKVDLRDGTRTWTKSYSVGDGDSAGLFNGKLIIHECWGVTVLSDGGYVLGCGVGIEVCYDSYSPADKADCLAGLGDKRPGAHPHKAGTWAMLLIRTDGDGNQVWRRVDSAKAPLKVCKFDSDMMCPAGCVAKEGSAPAECAFSADTSLPRGGCPAGCAVTDWQNQGTENEIPPSCTGTPSEIPPSCTGTPSWRPSQGVKAESSAAEWAVQTADGGIAVFGDEGRGVSVAKYSSIGSGTTSTVTPVSSSKRPATTAARLAEAAKATPALAEAPTASVAGANTFNLPVKSANLNVAPKPKFWTVVKGSPDAEMEPGKKHAVYGNDLADPNAVHGTASADGGFIHAGVGTSQGAGDSFAAKFSAAGDFVWGWKSGRSGPDVANAVCELPAAHGGGVIVVGAAFTLDGSNQVLRTLWKIDGATGAPVWTAQFNTGGGNSAFEMVDVTATGLILSGVGKKAEPQGMAFKSYGNVDSAEAVGNVMIIPFSALSSSTAPTNSDISKEFFFAAGSGTCKAARALPNGDIATVCLAPVPWTKKVRTPGVKSPSYRMALFDSALTPKWSKLIDLMLVHEPTDLTISTDGTEIVVSGHGPAPSSPTSASDTGAPNTYSGYMTSVKAADGTVAWQEPHNAGGIPLLQYNECWGISTVADGYVLTCGTGVECDPGVCCRIPSLQTGALFMGVTPESFDRPQATYVLEDKCDRGASDDRPGAVHRPPGKWSSMVIKTDKQGKMVWQRVDAYQDVNGDWGASAAAEFSVMTPNGIGVQTDLSVGFGLLYLEYQAQA